MKRHDRSLRQLLQRFAQTPPGVKLPTVKPPVVKPIRRGFDENTRTLRAERQFLLMRYDHYALPPAIYQVLIALERELAWRQYREGGRAEAR